MILSNDYVLLLSDHSIAHDAKEKGNWKSREHEPGQKQEWEWEWETGGTETGMGMTHY